MGTQQFFLKWNNHCSNMVTIFDQLLMNEALVDVTLACEGLSLKAHKIILSASSPFFQTLFLENPCKHPIVIMKDMKYAELKAVIDFIYKGEVNISHHQLPGLLKIAKELNIKGLMDMSDDTERLPQKSDAENAADKSESILPISVESNYEEFLPRIRKKRKGRRKKNCNSSCSDSEIGQYEIQNFPEIMEEILPESSSNPEHLKASDYHDFSYQSTSQDMYPPSYCQQNEICVYKDEISQDFKESVDEHSNHSESSIITDKKPECQEDTQEQMDSSAECEKQGSVSTSVLDDEDNKTDNTILSLSGSSSQERQLTELGNLQNQRVRKRKIEVLSLETRVQVIKESASGVTLRKLAEKFNCGKTQISNILQRKDYWLKEWEMNKNMNYKRKRKQPNEEVNKYVWEWFQKASATHIPISGPLIQEKAREFAEILNISSFRASNGWLDSFRKRHNIVFRSVDGEKRQLTAS